MPQDICPVCSSEADSFYSIGPKHSSQSSSERLFCLCPACSLVFQSASTVPEPEEELARYELHQNDIESEGYRKWLASFIRSSVYPWYESGRILDFGSGPRPVLTELLEAEGLPVTSYDPFYAPEWPVTEEGGEPGRQAFSLILLCEVLEHVHNPVFEFKRLGSIAAENALLSLKTQFLPAGGSGVFKEWWYKEDSTHIRFFNPESLRVLGEKSGWELIQQDGKSLAVYKKSSP